VPQTTATAKSWRMLRCRATRLQPMGFPAPLASWLAAGACCLAVCLVPCTGCGPDGGRPAARVKSLSADPARPAAGLVPQVIQPRRPFRVTDVASPQSGGLEVPATMSPPVVPLPVMLATAAGGTVRLVAAEEPAALPVRETAAASPVVAEIRDLFAGYLRAFNRHDAAAVAAHWAPAGENVNLDNGEVTAGREAVAAVFAELFASDPAATIDIDLAAIRPLREDVAVIDGISRVAYADGEVAGSRFSAVAIRHANGWQLESVREAATTREAAPPRPLDPLAWLVGAWENVGEGITAGSSCDWTAGRAFLVRGHTTARDAAAPARPRAGDEGIPDLLPVATAAARELTEIIGWDPERQEIRSWMFSSDGRFAEATWSRSGEGWAIAVEGRGLDAGRTATGLLLPVGPDAVEVRWQGAGLEGLLPPACSFTRTAR
jgi:uncharacterized protein (TIGR02246 family)